MMVLNHTQEHFDLNTPAELIHRRRRQVLIHSILYYSMDSPVIKDLEFDEIAKDLARLQKNNPEAASLVEYHKEAFKDFNGETGYHLPLADYRAILNARRLWNYHNLQERSLS